MGNILRKLGMTVVSLAFVALAVVCFRHGSSAGFELGLAALAAAAMHPIWWPKPEVSQKGHNG